MNQSDLDAYIRQLEESNAAKLAAAKAWMGTKWLLHPDNRIQRKDNGTFPQVF